MSELDEKWKLIFNKYNIENEIEKNGLFYITADQIREFKEPRLMTKFDTKESLPGVFNNKLGILPVTRGKYVIGEFNLYKDFPEIKSDITEITSAKIPNYFETIDINDIRSEANAINIMGIAGILEDFLCDLDLVQTISGRMGSGNFSFLIKDRKGINELINVQNSQVEIDGGFENKNIFSIIEGKNVVHSNFLVRQLYYPMRLWSDKIKKVIRPVFMVYSNNIFRLLEYEFTNLNYYDSIKLVQEKNYSLEDTKITLSDIALVHRQTIILPEPDVTFVQADSFNKIISLIENLNDSPMTTMEIAELFGFKERQSDYYFNACKYLGLAIKEEDTDGIKKVFITDKGKNLLQLTYKKRQLEYVKLILSHEIFNNIFEVVLRTNEFVSKSFIEKRMKELNICSDSLIGRRSSSVSGWIKWIFNLVNN